MHLIFSALITEKRFTVHPGTENLDPRNRPSVACSTLEGLGRLGIHSADFFLEFDETTAWSKSSVIDFSKSLGLKSTFHDYRLASFNQWQEAANQLSESEHEQLVLFSNDDHVLVSPNAEEFHEMARLQLSIQEMLPNNVVMVPLSHFLEHHALIPVAKAARMLKTVNGVPLVPNQVPGGPIVLSTKKFKDFWETDFTDGAKFVGLENPFGPSLRLDHGLYIPPRVEILRHLDSYGHIGFSKWPYQPLDPNLVITQTVPPVISQVPYSFTSDIVAPAGLNTRLLLSEQVSDGETNELVAAILKSSEIRFSLTSSLWTKSAVPASSVWKALKELVLKKPVFAIRILESLLVTPLYFFVTLITTGVRVINHSKLTKWFEWYITYASSVGFFRILWLSRKGLFRRSSWAR